LRLTSELKLVGVYSLFYQLVSDYILKVITGLTAKIDMANSNKQKKTLSRQPQKKYCGFNQINGSHPLREAVPNGFVDYPVRTRGGGEVFYFNFALAKEMGLIDKKHPEKLNKELCNVILDTFSLTIINEYDEIHNIKFPKSEIRHNNYMATRYLQSQHPGNKGRESGDGRSIWNGQFTNKSKDGIVTWDISSCGTGATRLSPATAIENKYFKTGDKNVSYGCGLSDLSDGVCAILMSEIFHQNEILTERTLGIISFDNNTSINIRASKNLLRPAHFFYHAKQNDYQGLQGVIDYYIKRQIENSEWPENLTRKNKEKKYLFFLERIATYFGRAAAKFESEYIFCWMDWDGDNILIDGGLIDFGSVRQFGLYHNEYRYDDDDRFSTTISEQKNKAKYIVQTFAQIVDYLITGIKKPVKNFTKDPAVVIFNQVFERCKYESRLYKMGFNQKDACSLLNDINSNELIRKYDKLSLYFEKAKSKKGLYKIQDGITWDAIFCLRDILRELPLIFSKLLTENKIPTILAADKFIDIIRSHYAKKNDLILYSSRKRKIRDFQLVYKKLLARVVELTGKTEIELLNEMSLRSTQINRLERITGDSIIYVANKLIKSRRKLDSANLHNTIAAFIQAQILTPGYKVKIDTNKKTVAKIDPLNDEEANTVLDNLFKIVTNCREGI